MHAEPTSSTRVLGAMLQSHSYDHSDICIMGYPQDVNRNSKQFMLRTTDGKTIPTVMLKPMDECLEGLVQIRGQFDGQKIQGQSYVHLLPDVSQEFDCETYNEAVKLLCSAK